MSVSTRPAPIVMAHGAFCGGWAFDAFRQPFESAGHVCTVPDLREGRNASGLSMRDYAAALSQSIEACPAPPVVIGHSLGGLAAQMAASRSPVSGLILLAPSAPWGVSAASVEEAAMALGMMSLGGPFAGTVSPDAGLFASCSLDRTPAGVRDEVLARMSPESGRALWETFNWWADPFMTTQVGQGSVKAPVLAVVGERDRICSPVSVRQTVARLGGSVRVMPGMSHWLIGEEGFEAVAALCLEWIAGEARVAA